MINIKKHKLFLKGLQYLKIKIKINKNQKYQTFYQNHNNKEKTVLKVVKT